MPMGLLAGMVPTTALVVVSITVTAAAAPVGDVQTVAVDHRAGGIADRGDRGGHGVGVGGGVDHRHRVGRAVADVHIAAADRHGSGPGTDSDGFHGELAWRDSNPGDRNDGAATVAVGDGDSEGVGLGLGGDPGVESGGVGGVVGESAVGVDGDGAASGGTGEGVGQRVAVGVGGDQRTGDHPGGQVGGSGDGGGGGCLVGGADRDGGRDWDGGAVAVVDGEGEAVLGEVGAGAVGGGVSAGRSRWVRS